VELVSVVRDLSSVFLLARLERMACTALGVDPTSDRGAVLSGVVGGAGRLAVALVVTAVTASWSGAPVLTWLLVAVGYGALDAYSVVRHRGATPPNDSFVALLTTLVRPDDARALSTMSRRWLRLRVSAPVAVAIVASIVLACATVSPQAWAALPPGSVALLLVLLYEAGELVFFGMYCWPFWRRESRYDHALFWLSPVNSPQMQAAVRGWGVAATALGVALSLTLLLGVLLVSFDSPLLLPLVGSVTLLSAFAILSTMTALRVNVRRIVLRVRDRNLAALQRHLTGYADRFAELSRDESDDLRQLLDLHTRIRSAPTSPNPTQTLGHALAALAIPAAGFFLAVLSEVYLEQVLTRLMF
jgi:hypothetical protein